ncbi:N-acetylmuramoyl-L-alanine amidase [Kiloniella antarctica]|uniref:N-acetylmuramoyl-L-alanine amidase n=1 Tax=Kiloniella antarctica TaxID=1550907 RepID=A0ABW5BN95_9PROT
MQINRKFQSPNYGIRPKEKKIDTLLLHYTGMKSGQEALDRLCDDQSQVSAHYLVEEDGCVFQMVDEENRAWHAGLASWQGESDINSCSIGIEIVNPGHEWGYRNFSEPQMRALIELCKEILNRHPIPPQRVLAHSDVAPERKEDPGELFDWGRLQNANIGLYTNNISSQSDIHKDNFLQKLSAYGYFLDLLSPEHPASIAAIIAFQRHFRPDKLDGVIDQECCEILSNLHSQLDAQNNPT